MADFETLGVPELLHPIVNLVTKGAADASFKKVFLIFKRSWRARALLNIGNLHFVYPHLFFLSLLLAIEAP